MSDKKDQLVDFSKEVAVAVKEAGSITQVVSFEEAEEASVAYASAKKRLKALEETRKSLLAPLKKAVTDLDSTLKANLAPLEAEVERLNSIVLAFHAAERKKAIDAQAAADAAAAKEQARLEAFRQKAIDRGDTAKAEAFEERAALVVPVTTTVEVPKVSGVGYRTTWSGELTDKAALIQAAASGNVQAAALLAVDQVALNRLATALKSTNLGVPGVRGVEKTGTQVR